MELFLMTDFHQGDNWSASIFSVYIYSHLTTRCNASSDSYVYILYRRDTETTWTILVHQ